MCDKYNWCIAQSPCPVHRRFPLLGPLESGHPTPSPYCNDAEAEYILQMCGKPPRDEEVEEDEEDEDDPL